MEVTELGLNRTYHISNKEIKGQRAIFTIKKEDTGIPINKDIFISKNRDILITPQFIDKEGLLEIFYYTLDLNKYKKTYYIIEREYMNEQQLMLKKVDAMVLMGYLKM